MCYLRAVDMERACTTCARVTAVAILLTVAERTNGCGLWASRLRPHRDTQQASMDSVFAEPNI